MKRYSEYIYFCGVVLGWLMPAVHSQSNEIFVSNEPAQSMLLDESVHPSEESVTNSTDLLPENISNNGFSTEPRFDYDNVTLTNEILDFEDAGASNKTDQEPGESKTPMAINYVNSSKDFDYRYPPSYDYSYDGLRNGTNRTDYGNPFGVIQTIFGGIGSVLANPFDPASHQEAETNTEASEKASNVTDSIFLYRIAPPANSTFPSVYLYKAPVMMDIPSRMVTQDPETTTFRVGFVVPNPFGTLYRGSFYSASGVQPRIAQNRPELAVGGDTLPVLPRMRSPTATTRNKPKTPRTSKKRTTTGRPKKNTAAPTDIKRFRALQRTMRTTAAPLLRIARVGTRSRRLTTTKQSAIRSRKHMRGLRNTRTRRRMQPTKRIRKRPRTRPTKRVRTLARPWQRQRPATSRFRSTILDYDFWYF